MIKTDIIKEVIKRIERKIYRNEKISIISVAEIAGYSKRHIQSLFKEVTGFKISSYIRKRKLSNAAILIRLTRISIFQISIDLGFASLQSFTRAFTREFHISPLKYRRNVFFDCSCLTPPFTTDSQIYLLRKRWINALSLSVKEFTLKESLIGRRAKRAEEVRKKEIDHIISNKGEVFVITTMIPESTLEHNVLLKTLIGFEDATSNYQSEKQECWVLEFYGEWDDYVNFGRFLMFNIDIELNGTFIEQIALKKSNNYQQEYFSKIYLPVK